MHCSQGQELVALASATAIAIAQGKDSDELSLLGNLFNLIGDALAVMGDRQNMLQSGAQIEQGEV
ncbi:MAG: hypothetical protein FWE06_04395 [Oscillospiraceae bacterium]|nr:hypothetical protein [Oscillospiraceae bacterium]